jgi:hypothetical protein
MTSLDSEDGGVVYVESDGASSEATEFEAEVGTDGNGEGDERSSSNATLSG